MTHLRLVFFSGAPFEDNDVCKRQQRRLGLFYDMTTCYPHWRVLIYPRQDFAHDDSTQILNVSTEQNNERVVEIPLRYW